MQVRDMVLFGRDAALLRLFEGDVVPAPRAPAPNIPVFADATDMRDLTGDDSVCARDATLTPLDARLIMFMSRRRRWRSGWREGPGVGVPVKSTSMNLFLIFCRRTSVLDCRFADP